MKQRERRAPSIGIPALWFCVLTAGLLLGGCATRKPLVSCQALNVAVAQGDSPRSIAVLPFTNHTELEGLEDQVRQSFASQISQLPYNDLELTRIDQKLRQHGISGGKPLYTKTVIEMGEILNCDALVYGDVIEFRRVFAGIYSSLTVGAAIQIWDARTGRKLWEDEQVVADHEGGVPLNVAALPIITLRSGMNLGDGAKIQAIDKLGRKLAERLPAPDASQRAATLASRYELQVAAFFNEAHARTLQYELKNGGYPAKIREERHAREDRTWYKVLLGPFPSQQKAAQVKQRVDQYVGLNSFICRVNL